MSERETFLVGDEAVLDGTTPVVVTRVGVYINSSMWERDSGVSVRPLAGGRAKPVALWRLTKVAS